jgi:hypothetical protein
MKVAIQINVFMRHAAPVRKAVRIQRMQIHHGNTGVARGRTPRRITERGNLHPGTAITFHAVTRAGDQQRARSIDRPIAHHIESERFIVSPAQRMRERLHGQTSAFRSGKKFTSRLGVTR